jgi:hypothetical protein
MQRTIIRRTAEKQLTAFLTVVSMTISLLDEVRGTEFDDKRPRTKIGTMKQKLNDSNACSNMSTAWNAFEPDL